MVKSLENRAFYYRVTFDVKCSGEAKVRPWSATSGQGVGIAVKRGNDLLRQNLNWALFQLWGKGSFPGLWLCHFPNSPFCKTPPRRDRTGRRISFGP